MHNIYTSSTNEPVARRIIFTINTNTVVAMQIVYTIKYKLCTISILAALTNQ